MIASRIVAPIATTVFPWLVLGAAAQAAANDKQPEAITIGSKKFTESVILGEMVARFAESSGAVATQRRELGGTRVLWNALVSGEIDLYPEYTGTIREEILAGLSLPTEQDLRQALMQRGILMSQSLGFNNTYAIGMRQEVAEKLNIQTISDLRRHPELRFGFSNEFMDRKDGWPSLRDRYQLPQRDVRGLDHDLAYRGMEGGDIQVTDLYSTDAEIAYYGLRVLQDDLGHFPIYDAVLLYRSDLQARAPTIMETMLRLQGRISAADMIRMNASAKLDKVPESRVAADFVHTNFAVQSDVPVDSVPQRIARHTAEHLYLVTISLVCAVFVAVPLGVLAAKRPRLGHIILGVVGTIQTIPSLALLVFMIPLLGIGGPPAIVALFLYSLLPIVRNTYTGLHDIPPSIRESAEALGLPSLARLRLVELPMATRTILAGIKTSAVINVGTATLGALIGAGGYGQPILTGIRLDDTGLILQGAIPAAVLALLVQGLFELAERACVPRGLRLPPQR